MKYYVRKGKVLDCNRGDQLLAKEWLSLSGDKRRLLLDQKVVIEVPDGKSFEDAVKGDKYDPSHLQVRSERNDRVTRVNQTGANRVVAKTGTRPTLSHEFGYGQPMAKDIFIQRFPPAEQERMLAAGIVVDTGESIVGNYRTDNRDFYEFRQEGELLAKGAVIEDDMWFQRFSPDDRYRLAARGVIDTEPELASVT